MTALLGWSLVAVVAAIVVIGAAMIFSQQNGGTPAASSPVIAPVAVTPAGIPTDGVTLGDAGARVTVDIYADFRCSACKSFTTQGEEKSIVDNYISNGKAKLVWHNRLIIDEILGGNSSLNAANAALCAADQGKFWTMHDWLYANSAENDTAFVPTRLTAIGQAAGLDMSRYQTCLDAGTHSTAISTENAALVKTITGTPTIYVAGKFVGAAGTTPSYDAIKAAIEAALAATPAPAATPTLAASPS
jgi:protein-disulfide isomerase